MRPHLARLLACVLTAGSALAAGSAEPPLRVVVLPDSGPVVLRPAAARIASTATLEEQLDACIRADMRATGAPGAALAVLVEGGLRYQQGYGVRRLGGSAPVTPETVFRIGSVTKMMTAAAVLQQVEAGTVRLEAPITEYIPELAIAGDLAADRITVHHLLSHTSGWPDRLTDLGPPGEDALEGWASRQGDVALHAPPGSFWNYSNPSYMLAGLVLERGSGSRYRDYLERSLWQPAGMTATTFDAERVMAGGNFAAGHWYDEATGEWIAIEPDEIDSWSGGPAGWAFSTVGDLVRWAELLMAGGRPVLREASAATMQGRRVWCNYTDRLFYGYGVLHERDLVDREIRYHDGSVIGWGSLLLWAPEQRVAVAVVSSTAAPLANAAFCALDLVVPPTHTGWDPTLYARVLPPFVGRYEMTDFLGDPFTAEASIDPDSPMRRLRLTVTAGSPAFPGGVYPLTQFAPSSFVVDTGPEALGIVDLTFIRGPDGRSPVRWMRSRYAVGDRQPAARAPSARRP